MNAQQGEMPRSSASCLNFLVVRASSGAERGGLTPVAQDYLKVIWTAQEWSREKVSTKMLAEKIGVSASTASESIRKLAEQGLVDHAKYGAVTLTEVGRQAALAMVRRHRLLETFLVNELGYAWDEVHDEAEVLEHAVSDRLVARIDAKLGFPRRDPHGDPIPASDGQVPTPPARQLWACDDGDTGDGGPDLGCRPGDAALLRQRRHSAGRAAARARPPRIRRNDLGGAGIRRLAEHRRTGKSGRAGDLGGRLTSSREFPPRVPASQTWLRFPARIFAVRFGSRAG